MRETLVLDERGLFQKRTAVWSMARKNGKSSLITGLGLWFLFNGDEGGEVYSCAAEKEQARITFGIRFGVMGCSGLALILMLSCC